MRKVVFLFGMLMAVNVSFGQYVSFDDVVIISKDKDAEEMTWFRYNNDLNTAYLYGTENDVVSYAKSYLEWAGLDIDNPTNVEYKSNGEKTFKTYIAEYEDGVTLITVLYINNENYAELSSSILNKE
jgi:hypothetical protein